MLPVTEAIHIVERETTRLAAESVALIDARGRVLAADIYADTDLPPFDRALMDGYAVRAADTKNAPATLRLVGEAAAGRGWRGELKAGEAVRIMTGAPVPVGADSVQQVEVTRETDEGATVVIDKPTETGQFISRRATEVRKGEVILRAGERINAAMCAALASFGCARVQVASRPRVVVLATGTELVRVDLENFATKEDVTSLRGDVTSLRSDVSLLREETNFIGGQVETMRNQMATKSDIARLEDRLRVETAAVRGDIEQVQLRLDSIDKTLRARLDEMEGEIARLRSVVYLLAKDRPELLRLLGQPPSSGGANP
jgi:MoeA N-terminal region (domain I and II)